MSEVELKRFWTETVVAGDGPPFSVHLDGRPVRTPLRNPLSIPSHALATAVAAEWDAQTGKVDPFSMPLTRYMNSVIDSVAVNREAVVDTVAAYGETDLLCYRASHPQTLVERQAAAWEQCLTWFARTHDAPMVVVQGILPVDQPAQTLAKIRALVAGHDDIGLAALHDLTSLSGSIILALAVSDGHLDLEVAWSTSRIDEDWQIERWGVDALAQKEAARKHGEFLDAARLLSLSRKP